MLAEGLPVVTVIAGAQGETLRLSPDQVKFVEALFARLRTASSVDVAMPRKRQKTRDSMNLK
jgi:hypothetical protein